MFKKFLILISLLCAVASVAALDLNKASEAELDSIKGIGPDTSGKILAERKKGNFKDWNDFITRVKGIGQKKSADFSKEGVTVNGAAYQPAAPGSKP
ncbi:MAG: hypothetical protein FD135_5020 [Comamonadaceae bacterium]|nr:MAG: hypothetical protein FD135_5020 [Comamonadaceae bacterium]